MDNSTLAVDQIRERSWNEAVYTYGTAYIFEEQANNYRLRLRVLAFLGIVGPLALGGLILAFGMQQALLGVAVTIAGMVGLLQLIVSAWSLTAKWEDSYSYVLESSVANYRLSNRFESLGKYPPSETVKMQMQFDLLQTENSLRSEQDNKQGVTAKEKRKGMRAALRRFQRQCAGCGHVPVSMTPSNCDICGNF